jgi:hypothetical protein
VTITLTDLERQLAQEQREHELVEQARSAIWMVGILVQKLGGEVRISDADMRGASGYRLVRVDDHEGRFLTLRMERAG